MGFKRKSSNIKGHRWINYPNDAHKKCTKCGCMVDITSSIRIKKYIVMAHNRKDAIKRLKMRGLI